MTDNTADRVAAWVAAEQAERPTWREAHRHACEVRHVAGLEHEAREAHLLLVLKRRGAEAHARLADDVLAALKAQAARRELQRMTASRAAGGFSPKPVTAAAGGTPARLSAS